MNETLTPEQLREVFLAATDPGSARVLALTCSLLLVSVVLWLVYRRGLREEYTPIWMGVAFALVLVSVRLDWLYALTRAIGAWTPSSLIFFLGEVFLVVICLNYAVRLSRTGVEIKNLAQEVSLLRARLERVDRGGQLTG
jgi:tellurite resistance protein TehA-like permease